MLRHRFLFIALISTMFLPALAVADGPPQSLELSRPVRPWEFLCAVGTRAGLFGNESGRLEAWVYPLKIVRDFRLRFRVDGHLLPAETLARTVIVRPESSTIVYAGNTFSVRETLFVPVREPGAVIILDVDTSEPLEVEAVFERDFQLEWPGALGGTWGGWDATLRAFAFGEEQRKFEALVGSPSATEAREEYFTSYSASRENSFRLGVTNKGRETKVIVIAGSTQGRADAENTYHRLSTTYSDLLRGSAAYYQTYLRQTVNLELPDTQLQQAYDWARISVIQGLVQNPFLGTGLIAGYRTSGDDQRPGFAWFFGRDSLWTSLALNAAGDFATTRTALDFVMQYERADGKIPHEIAQSASFVPWFKDLPYAYASADATPLMLIATNDYVVSSGDVAFAQQRWDNLWRTYQFLRSTYDSQGFPQNIGIGHGWVEGGPLVPIKTELYQSGLGLEALRSLSNLAHLVGKEDASKELDQVFARQKLLLNQTFWSSAKGTYAFGLDASNARVEAPSVLATVPMWFGLLEEDKANSTINQLAGPDHATDWGMRIISARDSRYNPGGYHHGSVWPLFTGWASVGEYRYHRVLPAYSNLRANVLLALDGPLGHVTEVLSGDYYQSLSTSSPHQIWSAAMVVSPLLRGLLGLQTDATQHQLTFAPHAPADWTSLAVNNLRVGTDSLSLNYRKTAESIALDVRRTGLGDCVVEFSPALSLRAQVLGAEMNGHAVHFHVQANSVDQHVTVQVPVHDGANILRIRLKNDFGLSESSDLPPLGSESRGLRVISESWSPSRDRLTVEVSGAADRPYELAAWNSAQIASVEGAELVKSEHELGKIRLRIPLSASEAYPHLKVTIHFSGKRDLGGSELQKQLPPNPQQ